ncbi:MAG: hypothetical protein CM15mP112_05250 [Flavobacteriales bacterium]|nr:MAG: hypothetical protein CM15mP112_05250 [Flavobacteriales bacterium]
MPLLYGGQEAGLDKRLKFFEKDTIIWDNLELSNFYKQLFNLKKDNQALWNGNYGGNIEIISSREDSLGFSFIRRKHENKVISIFNLSDKKIELKLNSANLKGIYKSVFTNDEKIFNENEILELDPWQFYIYTNKN